MDLIEHKKYNAGFNIVGAFGGALGVLFSIPMLLASFTMGLIFIALSGAFGFYCWKTYKRRLAEGVNPSVLHYVVAVVLMAFQIGPLVTLGHNFYLRGK